MRVKGQLFPALTRFSCQFLLLSRPAALQGCGSGWKPQQLPGIAGFTGTRSWLGFGSPLPKQNEVLVFLIEKRFFTALSLCALKEQGKAEPDFAYPLLSVFSPLSRLLSLEQAHLCIRGLKPGFSSVSLSVLLQEPAVPPFFPPVPLHIQRGFHGTNPAPDAAPAPHPSLRRRARLATQALAASACPDSSSLMGF